MLFWRRFIFKEEFQLSNPPCHDDLCNILQTALAGNTCYINASLQALAHCQPFVEYFTTCHGHMEIPRRTPLSLSAELAYVVQQLWRTVQCTMVYFVCVLRGSELQLSTHTVWAVCFVFFLAPSPAVLHFVQIHVKYI